MDKIYVIVSEHGIPGRVGNLISNMAGHVVTLALCCLFTLVIEP
jgi:hypothetical protein